MAGKKEIGNKKDKQHMEQKKDKYLQIAKYRFLQGFLHRIKQAKTDKEKLTILGSIYSNGFENGANEEKKTELHVQERLNVIKYHIQQIEKEIETKHI